MEVKQIYNILNDVMCEVTGQNAAPEGEPPAFILNEDLSNIVDMGTTVFNNNWRDNYVHSLLDRIGRDVFVDRTYEGYAPSVLRDSWEYGSIMAKTRCKVFDAKPNPSWNLEKGQTVNQFEFNPPDVTQKFYNSKVAWQIDCSFTEVQLKESFNSAANMNRFISMIENRIQTSMTIYIDSLIMRTINNFMAEKINANNSIVDVLQGFNDTQTTPITAADAVSNREFYRYLAYRTDLDMERFRAPSANFNIDDEANVTFTPREYAHFVLLSNFASGIKVYLQSDTYHENLVTLGEFETVPFWQSQGDDYSLDVTSRIDVKLASDNTKTVDRNYIIGVLFDRDALGVLNNNRRVTTAYNANGEYWNNFYKVDTSYFNDLAENAIIYVLGNGIPNVETQPMNPNATVWGYKVSDLQNNVKVNNSTMKISGTLEYIIDGALPPTWGNGNFLALQWLDIPSDATSCQIGIENLVEIINDPDRNGTVKVSDTTKKLKVITTTPKGTNTQEYDLSGLTLKTPSAKISPRDTTIANGATLQLTAADVYPAGITVTWDSSNTQVATVSDAGLVTGANVGNSNISAMYGAIELDKVKITVSAAQETKKSSKSEKTE